MRINSINSYSYRSNLGKCSKPCKSNNTSAINKPLTDTVSRQNLSFGTYLNIKGKIRTDDIAFPEDAEAIEKSIFTEVYVDPEDDKTKARLNKELIEKRGAHEFLENNNAYEVFNSGHPDDIKTYEDFGAIASAARYIDSRFAKLHYDVYKVACDYEYGPVAYGKDKFVKLKEVDSDAHTLHFEFVRDPFEANREPSKRKGFLGALERFAQQGEIQNAKMKNAEAFDLINKFEEKHGLKRGWELEPMDCGTEDGMKRFRLISELSCELYDKLGCIPPPPPTDEELEAQRLEAEKWQEEYANFQRFGDWF